MKIFLAGIFAFVVSVSSSFAGNCAKHNNAKLEAMSCQAGYSWDETSAECVQDASA